MILLFIYLILKAVFMLNLTVVKGDSLKAEKVFKAEIRPIHTFKI